MAVRKIVETISDRAKFTLLSSREIFREPRYLVAFLVALLFFLYFLTFFREGNSNMQLLFSGLPFGRKIELLGRVFVGIGENFTSIYGVSIIFLSLLQALIVMHLIFAWRHKEKNTALDGASTGGVGAVLGFIALGCPSCGIGLLTPILTAIVGASAATLAESIGYFLTVLAAFLLLFTIIRLGYSNYITIINKGVKEKHANRH